MCRDGKVDTGSESTSLLGSGGAIFNSTTFDVTGDDVFEARKKFTEDNDDSDF